MSRFAQPELQLNSLLTTGSTNWNIGAIGALLSQITQIQVMHSFASEAAADIQRRYAVSVGGEGSVLGAGNFRC